MTGRYKITLSYLGSHYHGWQVQPNAVTVQQKLEEAFSTLAGKPISIVGCGRTDTGVHARYYCAHVDIDDSTFEVDFFCYKLNRLLPKDIVVHELVGVSSDFHARFDATARTYRYYITFQKDPFQQLTRYQFMQSQHCEWSLVEAAAKMIGQAKEFAPFCKTNSDVNNYRCDIQQLRWQVSDGEAILNITANRFLRGMVRLIVGACLDVGLKKMRLEHLSHSITTQSPLKRSWSVPAQGLFLEKIEYS